jgi:hypothetical protein
VTDKSIEDSFFPFPNEREANMLDREQLRQKLAQIEESDFELTDRESVYACLMPMMSNIGDTEDYLRDELICSAFYEWIGKRQYFDDITLGTMMADLIGEEYLFYRIGNDGDPTVLKRSFTALVVGQIFSFHRKKNILDSMLFEKAKEAVFQYLMTEVDFRGYVPEYGWAHAAAHGSDALEEMMLCGKCDEQDLHRAFKCVRRVLYNGRYILRHEEDERLARAVFCMLKLYPSVPAILESFFMDLPHLNDDFDSRQKYIVRVNSKLFTRSMYFRLLHAHWGSNLIKLVEDTEKLLNRFA